MEAIDGTRFRVGDTRFVTFELLTSSSSTVDEFQLGKPKEAASEFAELLSEFHRTNIVELGAFQGGSAAFIALLAQPRKLVTLDIEPAPVLALEAFIERHGLEESVRTYWGVDQGDRSRVRALVNEEFGEQELDLVVDDASHRLDETRASFEVLFPLLRPNGLYLIEDWCWDVKLYADVSRRLGEPGSNGYAEMRERVAALLDDPMAPPHPMIAAMTEHACRDPASPWHAEAKALVAERAAKAANRATMAGTDAGGDGHAWRPLSRLVVELVLARACSEDAVREITVGKWWISVRRGSAALDPTRFCLADLSIDRSPLFGY